MADMAQDNFSGNCTVVDSPKVIWSLVWGVLFLGFGLFLLYASIKQGTHNGITHFLVALGVLNLIRFRVNAKGYVVDVEGDTLEFPGGGIEAQNWTTYFSTPCTGSKAS